MQTAEERDENESFKLVQGLGRKADRPFPDAPRLFFILPCSDTAASEAKTAICGPEAKRRETSINTV